MPEISAKLKTARNGSKTMEINHDGKTLFLHSAYNPEQEAQKLIDSLKIGERTLIICFGLGLGYYVLKIMARCKPTNRIIVIEPSKEIFEEACTSKAFFELNNYSILSVLVTKDEKEISRFLAEHINYTNVNKIETFIFPLYRELYQNECKAFLNCLKECIISKSVDLKTFSMLGQLWQETMFKNIHHILDSYYVDIFKNIFRGKPIVLIAGGPSLDKNVEYLKNISGKLPILCMYTAYKVLQNHGIEPDFLIAIDSRQVRFESRGERNKPVKVPLFFSSGVDPALLKKHIGPKIYFAETLEILLPYALEKIGVVTESFVLGGSVACAALSLAKYMGASEVIFVGQDLAVCNNRAHASGTFYEGTNAVPMSAVLENNLMVDGINGEKLYTLDTYLSFKVWIENFIGDNESSMKFIDASEGGALIKGTEIMTLRQAFCEYKHKSFAVHGLIAEALKKRKMLDESQKAALIRNINQVYESLTGLYPYLERGISICGELEDIFINNQNKENLLKIAQCKSELDEIDKRLLDKKEGFAIISLPVGKVLLDMETIKDDKQFGGNIITIRQNKALYDGLMDAILQLKPMMDALPQIMEV